MADNSPSSGGSGDVIATDDLATINGGATSGVKVQRTKVGFGSDSDLRDVDATHGLPVSLNAAAFIFSTNNSTTAQLAAGATFTGTIEAVLDQPSLSLLLTSDQPVTITVYPLIDIAGTFAGQPIVYYVLANQGFSTSVPLNCNYVKVTVKNTGTATTTTLNLSTAYGNLPSSDTQGRVPISQADCVPLLTATITATGSSASMDTLGYGAVVAQITGVWQGFCYFEASNNGSDWDTVLTFSRDSLSLQDIVTQGGMYTIRPSGRYLRLTVTNIVGSLVITAIGRAAEGIAASDLLSLAMDPINATPLQTQVQGSAGRALAQDPVSGAGMMMQAVRNFSGTLSATTGVNSVVGPFACADMQSIAFSANYPAGSAAVIVVEAYTGSSWQSLFTTSTSVGNGTATGTGINLTATQSTYVMAALLGSPLVRIKATTISGNMYITGQLSPNLFALATPIGSTSVTVSQGTPASLQVTTTPATPTALTVNSAATTNATSVKATAGTLYGIACSNTGAAAAFVKLYNKATAPTVGTDVPILTITVGASASVQVDWGALGYRFATGIALAITNLAADTDTTAVAAAQVKVAGSYI